MPGRCALEDGQLKVKRMPTPNTPDDATQRAIAALDTMAALWAVEIGLREMVEKIALMPQPKMQDTIRALVQQGFAEGAYKHHCDAMDGKVSGLIPA